MLEFLEHNYFIPFYAITLVLSIIRYRWYFDTVLRYLPILIGYTFLSELLGFIIRDFDSFQIVYYEGFSRYNTIIFNIFDIIFFLYFYYIFWEILTNSKDKRVPKYGAGIFIVVSIINSFFQDPLIYPQTYAIIIGSLILIACVLLYLRQLRLSKLKIPNHRNLFFWISTGLLIFYTVYPIAMSIMIVDYEFYKRLGIVYLHRTTIVVMYSCFIIGFLRMKGQLSKTLAQ